MTQRQFDMSLTAEDIESTARRAGWSLGPGRATQIAATAGPRVAAFERVRARLGFEDDAEAFNRVLIETSQSESAP